MRNKHRERDEKKIRKEENGMKHLSSCAGKTFRHVFPPLVCSCCPVQAGRSRCTYCLRGELYVKVLNHPGYKKPSLPFLLQPSRDQVPIQLVSRDNIHVYNTPLHYTGVDCPLLPVLTGNGWRIVRETSQEGWTQLVEDIKHRRQDTF